MHGNWIIQWRVLIMVIVTIASSILAGWKYTLFLFFILPNRMVTMNLEVQYPWYRYRYMNRFSLKKIHYQTARIMYVPLLKSMSSGIFFFLCTKLNAQVVFFWWKIPPFVQYLLHLVHKKSAVPVPSQKYWIFLVDTTMTSILIFFMAYISHSWLL